LKSFIRRSLPALLLPLLLTPCAQAGVTCRPKIGTIDLAAQSRTIWRGYTLSNGPGLEPRIELPLCGRAVTSLGPDSLEIDLEGHLPFRDQASDPRGRFGSAGLRYRRFLDIGGVKRSWLSAGVREYAFSKHPDGNAASSEVFVEGRFQVAPETWNTSDVFPHFELAHDFGRFRATYLRAGVAHTLPLLGGMELDASVAGSDYSTSRFAFHAFDASAWVNVLDNGLHPARPSIAIGAGEMRPARAVGHPHAWLGARLRWQRTGQ